MLTRFRDSLKRNRPTLALCERVNWNKANIPHPQFTPICSTFPKKKSKDRWRYQRECRILEERSQKVVEFFSLCTRLSGHPYKDHIWRYVTNSLPFPDTTRPSLDFCGTSHQRRQRAYYRFGFTSILTASCETRMCCGLCMMLRSKKR
jgi:hypothetical protein